MTKTRTARTVITTNIIIQLGIIMTHITASVALDYVPIIIMLQIGGREEIYPWGSMPWEGSKLLV